jgi:hypothetical protein
MGAQIPVHTTLATANVRGDNEIGVAELPPAGDGNRTFRIRPRLHRNFITLRHDFRKVLLYVAVAPLKVFIFAGIRILHGR